MGLPPGSGMGGAHSVPKAQGLSKGQAGPSLTLRSLEVPPSLPWPLWWRVFGIMAQTFSRESFWESAVPPAQAPAPQKPGRAPRLASSPHLRGPAQRGRPGGRVWPPQGLRLSSSGHWKVWSPGLHPAWGGVRGGGPAGAGSWSSGPSFVPHTGLSFPIGSLVSRAMLSSGLPATWECSEVSYKGKGCLTFPERAGWAERRGGAWQSPPGPPGPPGPLTRVLLASEAPGEGRLSPWQRPAWASQVVRDRGAPGAAAGAGLQEVQEEGVKQSAGGMGLPVYPERPPASDGLALSATDVVEPSHQRTSRTRRGLEGAAGQGCLRAEEPSAPERGFGQGEVRVPSLSSLLSLPAPAPDPRPRATPSELRGFHFQRRRLAHRWKPLVQGWKTEAQDWSPGT